MHETVSGRGALPVLTRRAKRERRKNFSVIDICGKMFTKAIREGGEEIRVETGQRALLIVPHQDDELFVGGGLWRALQKGGAYELYVVFTTNGDFYPWEAPVRLRESLDVLTRMYDMPADHVFFLGYGDGWKGGRHLYDRVDGSAAESAAGRRETYGIPERGDYRYEKSGRHSMYCRADFKRDLRDVMADVAPSLIVAVDYDKHPDHKAASLMAEECIGELMRERKDYRPTVLKRYAYDGVWKGAADFFEIPRKPTVLRGTDFSPYTQEDQIRIAMPWECCTPRLAHNFLYAASRRYRTQAVWQKADEIINIDEVYWRRRTDSLLYGASLAASSGNAEYVRDFKLFDCGDVMQRKMVYRECGWLPDEDDDDASLTVSFDEPKKVARIDLYALGDPDRDRLAGEIVFDSGMRLATGPLRLDGRRNRFVFEPQRHIRRLVFCMTERSGSPLGITEMEVFAEEGAEMPVQLREQLFRGDRLAYTAFHRLGVRAQEKIWKLHRKVDRWLPNRYELLRQYPELSGRGSVPPAYRFRYIARRFRDKMGK